LDATNKICNNVLFSATEKRGDVDRQVERVRVQKFEPGRIFQFAGPPEVLPEAPSGKSHYALFDLEILAEGLV
jgi:hypothetical protein